MVWESGLPLGEVEPDVTVPDCSWMRPPAAGRVEEAGGRELLLTFWEELDWGGAPTPTEPALAPFMSIMVFWRPTPLGLVGADTGRSEGRITSWESFDDDIGVGGG